MPYGLSYSQMRMGGTSNRFDFDRMLASDSNSHYSTPSVIGTQQRSAACEYVDLTLTDDGDDDHGEDQATAPHNIYTHHSPPTTIDTQQTSTACKYVDLTLDDDADQTPALQVQASIKKIVPSRSAGVQAKAAPQKQPRKMKTNEEKARDKAEKEPKRALAKPTLHTAAASSHAKRAREEDTDNEEAAGSSPKRARLEAGVDDQEVEGVYPPMPEKALMDKYRSGKWLSVAEEQIILAFLKAKLRQFRDFHHAKAEREEEERELEAQMQEAFDESREKDVDNGYVELGIDEEEEDLVAQMQEALEESDEDESSDEDDDDV